MGLVVQKFGGSSVADVDRIKHVAKRVMDTHEAGDAVVVVVSALGDTTDDLIQLALQITPQPSDREMDVLMSTGEQISIALLSMAIHAMGHDAISFTGPQLDIVTDSAHRKARILSVDPTRIRRALDQDHIVIVAGFQGRDADENITTLGRGGSDTTAVALAAVLEAPVCEIYTDVDGVYTADPRIVPDARKIPVMHADEMLEMASAGSQVMNARAVEYAKKYGVPLHIRSSFAPDTGTLVTDKAEELDEVPVRGVSLDRADSKITIRQVPDRPGVSARLFTALSEADVNVDMIIQNVAEGEKADISFTVNKDDLNRAMTVCEALLSDIGGQALAADSDIAKVSIVGAGMAERSGVAAVMFSALGDAGVNIEMIATSEIKTSCIVRAWQAEEATRVVHAAFALGG